MSLKNNILAALCFCMLCTATYADDITPNSTPSAFGMNNGAIELLMSGGYAPYQFSWTGPGGFVSTDQNISGLAPGEYCVTVTDAYCGTAYLCITVEEAAGNAIEDFSALDVSVYPVPADNSLHVQWQGPGTYTFTCSLYTLDGKLLFQTEMHSDGNGIYTDVPTEALPSGIYNLMIRNPEGQVIKYPFAVSH
ncbi:MAG: T9SS type A sorting domain-containing protein [Chitinophagales bacterium]